MNEDAELAALLRRGEHLEAYDLACRRLAQRGFDAGVAQAAVLSLARSGATDFARREFARWRLGAVPDAITLGARLLKDVALASRGARRRAFARAAAMRYAAAVDGGGYSAINFATLSLVGGDRPRAMLAAARIVDCPAADTGSYHDLATRAEALLLLGRTDAARDTLAAAITRAPRDHSMHAATIRQFETILAETGAPDAWLAPLRPPCIAHFTGRIFAPGDPGTAEAAAIETLARVLGTTIAAERIGHGYGSLAAGTDILCAEALVAAGAELHVVLALPVASFVATSVRPYGEAWVRRFEASLARARSLRFAARDPYAGDDQVFAYASQFAIGCAVLRAEALATDAVQIAVSSDTQARGSTVTADLAYWSATARRQIELPLDLPIRPRLAPARAPAPSPTVMKAMLFVDVRGFGALRDDQIPTFFDVVMADMARTIAALPTAPEHVETWGDGVFLVFPRPVDAAEAAMAILAAHRRLNLAAGGLPRWLALRIGGHYGPVHERRNPILGTRAVVGAHVVVAARIEPNVAPGSVYVSEPFAAALAALHGDRFACGYVGRTRARRDFPPLSIFNLARRLPATR